MLRFSKGLPDHAISRLGWRGGNRAGVFGRASSSSSSGRRRHVPCIRDGTYKLFGAVALKSHYYCNASQQVMGYASSVSQQQPQLQTEKIQADQKQEHELQRQPPPPQQQQQGHEIQIPQKPLFAGRIVIRQGRLESTVITGTSDGLSEHRTDIADIAEKTHAHAHKTALPVLVVTRKPRQVMARIWDSRLGLSSRGGGISERIGQLWATVVQAFLPADYKTSVLPEYISFAKWQFVHNTLGAASGVLATQSMLYAMGLGAGALPLSAAINWVVKDGFGQLGGVLYATMVGRKFDSDPKHQRFWSAVWLQCATWLEMLTPLAPHLFLPIGSVANIGKNISWLAMSATKAAINKSFCRKENLGELTAKQGSQATAAGLLGTAAGIVIGGTMDITVLTLIVGFVPLSIISLWGNYKSLLYAATQTLNLERAQHMVNDAVVVDDAGRLIFDPYLLKTPRQVSHVERFMRKIQNIDPRGALPGILVVPDIQKLDKSARVARIHSTGADARKAEIAAMLQDAFCPPASDGSVWSEKYYIGYLDFSAANGAGHGNICIWFSTQATSDDMLQGFYHAQALRQLVGRSDGVVDGAGAALFIQQAYLFSRRTFTTFREAMSRKGWDASNVYFVKSSQCVDVENN